MNPKFLRTVVASLLAVGCAVAGSASAQDFPTRPIRLVVPAAAGQTSDLVARLIADELTKALGQPVVVDNKPGAGGVIAMVFAQNAPADGYTLVLGSTATLGVNPNLYKKLPYSPLEFVPLAHLTSQPLFLITSAKSGIRDFASLVAHAKANPGKLNYGSSGNGTTQHAAMEVLKAAKSLDITHVVYKSAPQMNQDLMAGVVDVAFEVSTLILPQLKSNRVNFIGVSTAQRSSLAPDLPTLAELGVDGYNVSAWAVLVTRKGAPQSVIDRYESTLKKIMASAEVQSALRNGFSEPGRIAVADLPKFLQAETDFWGKAMRQIGMLPQ